MSSQYIPWAAATHKGLVRAENQDAFQARPDLGLWVVCDGLGGHAGGRDAANTAADTVVRKIEEGFLLREAILSAHEQVRELARSHPEYGRLRPGSTITALHALPGGYTMAWAGDSKGFAWDGRALRQVTRDHTYVQQLIDEGRLAPKEKYRHPFRNVLTSALGQSGNLEIGMEAEGWKPLETAMILATDGLDCVGNEAVLAALLKQADNPDEAAGMLIRSALKAGGPDNITLAVIGWPFAKTPGA